MVLYALCFKVNVFAPLMPSRKKTNYSRLKKYEEIINNPNLLNEDFTFKIEDLKSNHNSLLLALWSQEKQNNKFVPYEAGPNMEQKNTFETIQYMTRTWKKNTTFFENPINFVYEKNKYQNTFEDNHFRILTPELLGYTVEENWKNKKATLTVILSDASYKLLSRRRLRSLETIDRYDTDRYIYRHVLKSNVTLQTILEEFRFPKAWLENIYNENNGDRYSSELYIKFLYNDMKKYIQDLNIDFDNLAATKTTENSVRQYTATVIRNIFKRTSIELKVYFDLKHFLLDTLDASDPSNIKNKIVFKEQKEDEINTDLEYKDSFFKISITTDQENNYRAKLYQLNSENERFNITYLLEDDYKNLELNLFAFINYAYKLTTEQVDKYVYIQELASDVPYIELKTLGWSNIGNIFENSKNPLSMKERLVRPIFPEQKEEQKKIFKINSLVELKKFQQWKKKVKQDLNRCQNPKNVYPMERKINLKYGCLVPFKINQDIFRKTSKTLLKHIAKISRAKNIPYSLHDDRWFVQTKFQLLKSLVKRRQAFLLRKQNGCKIWDQMNPKILKKEEIIDFKNQLYKLNEEKTSGYFWSDNNRVSRSTPPEFGLTEATYYQGEIVYAFEFGEKWYYQLIVEETKNTTEPKNNANEWGPIWYSRNGLPDRLKVKLRPVSYGIYNQNRYYREDTDENFVYRFQDYETPTQNIVRNVTGNINKYLEDIQVNSKYYKTTDWQNIYDDIGNGTLTFDRGYVGTAVEGNKNFVNVFDDTNFVNKLEKLWGLDHYKPSKYLINEFEFLCGYTTRKLPKVSEKEFFLTEEDEITIKSYDYEELTASQGDYRKLRNPYENDFEIEIEYYYNDYNTKMTKKDKTSWWDAWFIEYRYKLNLFNEVGGYTDLELETLKENYRYLFVSFVNVFQREFDAPPISYVRKILKYL